MRLFALLILAFFLHKNLHLFEEHLMEFDLKRGRHQSKQEHSLHDKFEQVLQQVK